MFIKTVYYKKKKIFSCNKNVCSHEISTVFLQNWNISSSDTLKPKNIPTIKL